MLYGPNEMLKNVNHDLLIINKVRDSKTLDLY